MGRLANRRAGTARNYWEKRRSSGCCLDSDVETRRLPNASIQQAVEARCPGVSKEIWAIIGVGVTTIGVGAALGTLIVTGHHSIHLRFDAIDQRFDSIDRRFDAIDRRFDSIERQSETTP